MKFTEILKEVLWRLSIEGRVSYHSIRGDFGLDDEAPDDLRFFLIEEKALAMDLDGKFLVRASSVERTSLPRNISELQPFATRQAALDVARTQQAKSLELLAARDLAALWAETGERRKAHDLLASVYGTFTEGFDAPALASSRQLLDALR